MSSARPEKDESIRALLRRPEIAAWGWKVEDHWEGDLFAIGLANSGRTRLAYISTWKERPGEFYLELEEYRVHDPEVADCIFRGDCDETSLIEQLGSQR